MNIDAFLHENTELTAPPLVPELKLHLAREVTALWQKTEAELDRTGIAPPYWAFAWPGGQALARHVIDHPALVRGKRVLDVGAGSGLVALAAAKAGAQHVTAADIDPMAPAVIHRNALANGLRVEAAAMDATMGEAPYDLILIGDMFYERALAERLLAWLTRLDAQVLIGDPGRSYFPKNGLLRLATYKVPTSRDLEDRDICETGVWRRDSRLG
ncbi:MAG: class I SAM-dependent methyltransferase [Rhizomicrobium sp.]